MAGILIRSKISPTRERNAAKAQFYIKQWMRRKVDMSQANPSTFLISGDRDVIAIDSVNKTAPEATEPNTFEIPSDDKTTLYTEVVTGRPTLGTGNSEMLHDPVAIAMLERWILTPEDVNLAAGTSIWWPGITGLTGTEEDTIISIAWLSETGAIRIYPKYKLLSISANAASSENTYATMTLNGQRKDQASYDRAYTLVPPSLKTGADATSVLQRADIVAPDWSCDKGLTYADALTLYTTPAMV